VISATAGNGALPASTDFRSGVLAFKTPVNGTGSLQFVPVVFDSDSGQSYLAVSNLLIGQNNEGFGLFSVANRGTNGAGGDVVRAGESDGSDGLDVYMKEDSLGGYDLSGRFETNYLTGTVGAPIEMRICGHANQLYPSTVKALVYAGHPVGLGSLLVRRALYGINGDEGTCAWFSWTPTEAGRFQLHGLLLESTRDVAPANNLDVLEVEILTP